jgi:hypothetical protein
LQHQLSLRISWFQMGKLGWQICLPVRQLHNIVPTSCWTAPSFRRRHVGQRFELQVQQRRDVVRRRDQLGKLERMVQSVPQRHHGYTDPSGKTTRERRRHGSQRRFIHLLSQTRSDASAGKCAKCNRRVKSKVCCWTILDLILLFQLILILNFFTYRGLYSMGEEYTFQWFTFWFEKMTFRRRKMCDGKGCFVVWWEIN